MQQISRHPRETHDTPGRGCGMMCTLAALIATVSAAGFDGLHAETIRPDLTAMVPMGDGTALATDVYLPGGEGPWPVRLIRTPYGRRHYNHEYGARARDGYVMIVQDMRGRFDSEGRDLAFLDCGWNANTDGIDTLKWIAVQPWCNGRIGTEGASAMGITQYRLGAADPPDALKAQYILVAVPSLYHHASYVGGALRASLTVGWLTDAGFDPDNIWLLALHPFYDDHWQALNALERTARVRVPAVHVAGWFDVFQQGNIDAFVAWHNAGGPGARGRQKLIIGPWPHGQRHGRPVGELTFPDNTRDWKGSASQWFDHYLKGIDNGVDRLPAVQYYTMGAVGEADAPGNEWRTADNWPVPAEEIPFYLHADGSLQRERPVSPSAAVDYTYDPMHPVPTRGGCLLLKWKEPGSDRRLVEAGVFDQRDLEARPDVVTFTTPPLTEPLEVTGRLIAKLWITSDRVDTDFAVKLTDVYPDGRSMSIADGLARCRYREGYDRLAWLTPGEPVEIEVDLWSTSMIFNKGHRIRIAVTSSNYPRFDVNLNTGWPGWPMAPALVAHNRILCTKDHPSRMILPIASR